MIDDQVRKILDKTFAEVNLLVKEVQSEKKTLRNSARPDEINEQRKTSLWQVKAGTIK